MGTIEIKRPVAVKVIMTEDFRKEILDETMATFKKNEETFAHAEELYKRTKTSGAPKEQLEAIKRQLDVEKARFEEMKRDMEAKMEAFKNVPEGEEIAFRILEGPVSVKEGDDFKKVLGTAEIVLKDWKVVELRGV